ncbi:MAG: ATP-binding protein, partial [Dehalococcoidales bacterium]
MPKEESSNGKKAAEYSAKDIQVLEGLEAVRKRPGMYIGSTDQRGLHHLVYEIAYNSVDEAMSGTCDRIDICISEDNVVTVEDNGRGIPVEIHPTTGVSALQTVMTVLHAGGKFGGKAYQVSGGLHGVGASVVNALSEWMQVTVKRNGKKYAQEYKRGIPVGPVAEVGKAAGTGTITSFLADKTVFTEMEYDFDMLADRIREMAYLNRALEISFDDKRHGKEQTYYFEGGITGFVR